jgi:ankyrin repeat protein
MALVLPMGNCPPPLSLVFWPGHPFFQSHREPNILPIAQRPMLQTPTMKIIKYAGIFLGIALSLTITSGWKTSDESPIIQAIRNRDLDTVQELIRQGADVNATTSNGGTPLHYAAESGQYPLTRLLLQQGADVHILFQEDWTPLHFAAKRGHVDIANLLISHGAAVNMPQGAVSPLHVAVQERQRRMVVFLLSHGARVDSSFKEGWTALHLAAQTGDIDVARLLLDAGAPINAPNVIGLTPLHSAALSGHLDLTKFLISRGSHCTLPLLAPTHSAEPQTPNLPMPLQAVLQDCRLSNHS